jgi:hypothetical protein
MNQEKLSKKLYLQWYILRQCKDFPRSFDELFHLLQQDITLPRSIVTDLTSGKHSDVLLRRYIKVLEKEEYVIYASKAYTVTKTGHQLETSLRLDLRKRLKAVHRAVERMLFQIAPTQIDKPIIMVPESDREFLRGAISVKDIVRYFTLDTLSTPGTKLSVTSLRELMVENYGWTCSKEYFFQLVRDELGDGQEKAREFGREVNPDLANCVVGQWEGERRNQRLYRITEKGHHWHPRFREDAEFELKEANRYIQELIDLTEQ